MLTKKCAIRAVDEYGSIHANGYNWLLLARKIKTECSEIKSEWRNGNRRYDFIDPPNIEKENTYPTCVSAEVSTEDNNLLLSILIYDGDMSYGERIDVRCKFTLTLTKMYREIDHLIMKSLVKEAEQRVLKEEKRQFNLRTQKELDSVLKELNTYD